MTRRIPVAGVLAGFVTIIALVLLALVFWGPVINEQVERKEKVQGENATSRLAFWDAALRMSYDRPITGVGPGRFGEEAETYVRNAPIELTHPVAHNSYLEILAESGVFALGFFLAYLAGTWRLLRRTWQASVLAADAEGVRLTTALQASFVVAVVGAFFLSQQLALPLWLIGALAAALAWAPAAEPRGVGAAPPRLGAPAAA